MTCTAPETTWETGEVERWITNSPYHKQAVAASFIADEVDRALKLRELYLLAWRCLMSDCDPVRLGPDLTLVDWNLLAERSIDRAARSK